MKDFWNQRYAGEEYAYGEAAVESFREYLVNHKPGRLLLPAEGEGRNAVFAAVRGWTVDAFDYSHSAQKKALMLAEKNNVSINYFIADHSNYKEKLNEAYDLIGLFYFHIPEKERIAFHKEMAGHLVPGGKIFLQAFSKEQINNSSGGPKNPNLLYDSSSLKHDFAGLNINRLEEKNVYLREGRHHQGEASLCIMEAIKPFH